LLALPRMFIALAQYGPSIHIAYFEPYNLIAKGLRIGKPQSLSHFFTSLVLIRSIRE
jgi:hypothetical protein